MSINLESRDFARVVEILSALPEFRTGRSRIDLMTDVFAGTSRADDVITTLDLDGSPRAVAVRVVQRLQSFGQDEPGRETLGVLINKMLAYLGAGEHADDLRDILARYPFETTPTADSRGITGWSGRESPGAVHERIIGENTLRDVFMLEMALEAARAVVRIRTPAGLGTGFLISPTLVMTNNHVIPDAASAIRSEFAFNYQIDRFRKQVPGNTYGAARDGLFYTNPELDFTVVELRDADDVTPLELRPRRAVRGDRVNIIQHPGGHYKKISMQNNFVAYADDRIIQYTTSTEPGSSGSPVFDNAFEVIGVHHAGGMLTEPGNDERYLRNEGISAIAILADLRNNGPLIATRIAR
ncbi:trypsin-like peptidase domain-containing protein [Nocardia abscessus]|uniref:trypsin-like peptidase domain-containing protein n=1 Tax=Nocardia abscessus TaxID=120957 RepID=UPI001892DB70|nr:trypsin-like peptidase domain-containing protein [Nocardia abscessus]MBF6339927.1 trypsin-like peptidase domain-containing protein [Nocardia abscessus]